jgi:isochorismate synthase
LAFKKHFQQPAEKMKKMMSPLPNFPYYLDRLTETNLDFALFFDISSEEPEFISSASQGESDEEFVVAPFCPEEPVVSFRGKRFSGRSAVAGEIARLLENAPAAASAAPEPSAEELEKENAAARELYFRDFSAFHAALSAKQVHKLVLSRTELVRRKRPLTDFFASLVKAYPHAYRFFVKAGGVVLTGASPELLCDLKDGALRVMALAGTMPKNAEEHYEWSEKNILEQKIVTDFIAGRLKGVSETLSQTGPVTHSAGPVVHLLTLLESRLKEGTDTRTVIGLLHPTPAVCGLPQEEAMDFILKNESYNRGFYCGYLGVVGDRSAKLYVNLRSARIEGGAARCYGGGGLLAQSEANDEWQETCRKISTLKEML